MSLEEANAYLAAVRHAAGKIALGAALCILSPVGVLCLAGLSEGPGSVPENATVWAGVPFLLLLVGCAVALFLFYGRGLEAWDYLEREEIELAYGVTGVVQKLSLIHISARRKIRSSCRTATPAGTELPITAATARWPR